MRDYGVINAGLEASETGTLAAALHGYCVGALCVAATDLWEGFTEEFLPGRVAAPTAALAEAIQTLLAGSAQTLEDGQFEFELLLPDDDAPLALRVACLAAWADGYLRGIAQTQVELSLSVPAEEALRDIEAIAQAEEDADEDDADAETALVEVAEHLRLAVAQLYADLAPARASLAPQETGDFDA
jgi:uncharacterized protein YgfB (UPF0149 family)